MTNLPSNKDDLWLVYFNNRNKSSLGTILVTYEGSNGDLKAPSPRYVIPSLEIDFSDLLESKPRICQFINKFWIIFYCRGRIYN
jgi:hypothetical protein